MNLLIVAYGELWNEDKNKKIFLSITISYPCNQLWVTGIPYINYQTPAQFSPRSILAIDFVC